MTTDESPRFCEACDLPFTGGKSSAKYCSESCKTRARKVRQRRRATGTTYELVCEYCEEAFTHSSKDKRFCSPFCASEMYRAQQAGTRDEFGGKPLLPERIADLKARLSRLV